MKSSRLIFLDRGLPDLPHPLPTRFPPFLSPPSNEYPELPKCTGYRLLFNDERAIGIISPEPSARLSAVEITYILQ